MPDERGKILIEEIVKTFEDTYCRFLTEERVQHSDAVEVGFYMAARDVIERDSVLDGDVRAAILKRLDKKRIERIEDYVESVEKIFTDLVKTRKNPK